jgi:hypothetical protein
MTRWDQSNCTAGRMPVQIKCCDQWYWSDGFQTPCPVCYRPAKEKMRALIRATAPDWKRKRAEQITREGAN